MLLSLWAEPGVGSHARLVKADVSVRDFDSPFELARHLTQQPRAVGQAEIGGLR